VMVRSMSSQLFNRISPAELEIISRFIHQVPVKIGALAEALGLTVLRSTLGPNISGMIQPDPAKPDSFVIKVNRFDNPDRQRFTIAHEIAHFLLHRDRIGNGVIDNVLYRSNLSSRMEVEANQLAAELVMPMKEVRARLMAEGRAIDGDLAEDMADDFRVSVPAMRVRLGLGLES
jgi:Zn-dependent peptidase ImmA (M78 family)